MSTKLKLIAVLLFLTISGGSFFYAIRLYSAPKIEATKQVVSNLDSEKLWSLIQEWRVSVGKPEYQKQEALCQIADTRAKELYVADHGDFLERYNNKYPSILSENLVSSSKTETGALNGWLNSKPHHDALLRSYTYSCVATKGNIAVHIFSNCENGCP